MHFINRSSLISLPFFVRAHYISLLAVSLVILIFSGRAAAQQADTANKITIHILDSKNGYYFNTDSGSYNKFVDSVIFMEGSDTLYCDSAVQNSLSKNFEAFGDVRIAQQDGTQATSDYLRYTAAKKTAYMSGNVRLNDKKNNLDCAELTYDVGNKIADYNNGGTLYNDSTTVTSHAGNYNVKTKDARFTGRVVITDPQYKIRSEDLVYNTESKLTTIYAKSTITSDSGRSILQTRNGTYDGKNGIAHFVGHSTIWDDGHYIEGDSLYYNKLTGYGLGIGNVIAIDTEHHSTIYCGRTEYFQKQKVLWAMIKPVVVQVNGKDTLYMRADTIYSAPMQKLKITVAIPAKAADTAIGQKEKRKHGSVATTKDTATSHMQPVRHDTMYVQSIINPLEIKKNRDADSAKTYLPAPTSKSKKSSNNDTMSSDTTRELTYWVVPPSKIRVNGYRHDTSVVSLSPETPLVKKRRNNPKPGIPVHHIADTTAADTTAPQFFVGYNHVLLFSDSMQGKCDSIIYTRSDSTIRMIYNPILWSHRSQITGDTILLGLDSSGLRSLYVPSSAFVVSLAGPEKAQLYDQVQGRTLTAWFKDNNVDSMLVFPEAESIYYSKDDGGAYLGVNQANSTLMRVFFNDQKLKKIKFEKDVHQTMTPLDVADLPNTRLGRFRWLNDQRPKSKDELFK